MLRAKLKQILPLAPRGIYGRAAMIMLMPILGLQLIVSFVFIKQDLEDVTNQMSRTMLREFRFVQDTVANASTKQEALATLESALTSLSLDLEFLDEAQDLPQNSLRLIDFSGRVVRDYFHQNLPGFYSLQLGDGPDMLVVFDTAQGPVSTVFNKRYLIVPAPHQLIVIMLVFGLFLMGISLIYMRNQLRPIKRLATVAEAFGRGEMLPYNLRGAAEVRAAGAAFLHMRARIERHIEQRTLMLSGVSHDLRTPLTRMKLELSMMDAEDAAGLLADVKEMESMVDAFLDFSRGVSTSETESTDPFELAATSVKQWREQGEDVQLSCVGATREVPLRPAALKRAIDNLISNSVRYGERAHVSVEIMQKSVRIRVEDDGPGIAPELRGDALKPFTRLDRARNQDLGTGVGLGLAIVADVARAHGGTLRLSSSDRLGGVRADIIIPI